jgi:putative N6-adenine-specific DNA methylase
MVASRHTCFAVCAPGLEHLAFDEIAALGVVRPRSTRGGVTFVASTRQLYASNAMTRTVTRVLTRLVKFRASDFAQLERHAKELPWDDWLAPNSAVRFRVSSSHSRLYHTAAIEERLRRALPPSPRQPVDEQLVVVRLSHDEVTISVDSSGDALHKRGWRRSGTKAPLRETLAAAMLLAIGWDGTTPLVDPFCGSGTIAIEAALLGARRAPWVGRTFAFERWPSFEPGTYASVRAAIATRERDADPSEQVFAGDRDAGAVTATLDNARRAGVADALDVRRATVSELATYAENDVTGWIVTNPPYGRRVSPNSDLRDLFARFGDVVRSSMPGWGVAVLTADPLTVGHARLDFEERLRTRNGGIPVRLLVAPPGVAS